MAYRRGNGKRRNFSKKRGSFKKKRTHKFNSYRMARGGVRL